MFSTTAKTLAFIFFLIATYNTGATSIPDTATALSKLTLPKATPWCPPFMPKKFCPH